MKRIILLFLVMCGSVFASSISEMPLKTSMVVYGADMAYVQESHAVSLEKGKYPLLYKGVTANVLFQSIELKLPDDATVMRENFRNNTPTLNRLLRAFVGKKVGYDKRQVTLLSASGLEALVQDTHGKIFSVKAAELHFFSLPPFFSTKPLLTWEVDATKQIKGEASLSYLVRNISWKGEYFLHVRGDVADLTGQIAINNATNKSYKNSTLFVVAGAVATGVIPHRNVLYSRAMSTQKVATVQGYHIYPLPMKVDVAADSTTRIKFLEKKALQCKRKYVAIATNPQSLRGASSLPVAQYITFKNEDFILPAGEVRVYSHYENSTIFIGQTHIPHTPKASQLKLNIGNAFDLHVRESIVQASALKNMVDTKVLYSVQNRGDKVKTITLKISFISGKYFHIKTAKSYQLQDGYALFKIKVQGNSVQSFQVEFQGKK